MSRYRQVFPRLDNAAVSEIRLSGDSAEPAALLSLNVPVIRQTPQPPEVS